MRKLLRQHFFMSAKHKAQSSEAGFTIVETSVAMVIMMIAALASASLFAFAIKNNSGANDRELAMAVAQQEMERLRSVSFSDTDVASTPTAGTTRSVTRALRSYTVNTRIVDSNVVNGSATMKTITVQVTPGTNALGSVTLVALRSSIARGPNAT